MPDLSACYFCGTALDEPLSEYPVVPLTLQPAPEDQKTVVLCSACRRKLGRVLDAVLEAIEDPPIDATVQQDLEAASEEPSANHDTVDAGDSGEAAAEPDEDVWVTPGDSEYEEEPRDDAVDADETDVEDDEDGVGADEEDDPVGADEAGDPLATGDPDAEEPPADDPPTAADGTGEDEDGPHLTALEYTKVMRLLENRDLPVDREEFRVVATNAYEITNEEFDAVVDAAIDRGLIVEEDGEFVDVE